MSEKLDSHIQRSERGEELRLQGTVITPDNPALRTLLDSTAAADVMDLVDENGVLVGSVLAGKDK